MTTGRAPPARVGLPLTVQVMALVLGTIIAAQGVTILAVFLAPPTAQPVYSVGQVAAALKGQALAIDQGRRLRRTIVPQAPADLDPGGPSMPAAARLAEALGVSEQDVRARRRRPPPFVMLTSADRLFGPGPQGPHGPRGPGFGPPPRDRYGPGPPPEFDSQTLRGEFIVGWRQGDGRWVVVEPQPEMEWLRRIAIWVAGGLLVMGPIGYWFARRISAPLKAFVVSAETLGRDPQAPLLTLSGPAEIGVAARAFNAMQARLQRYVSDRVSMVGAISHDLRTPLTRIRFKLEQADPDLRGAVLSDVGQMEHMINAVIAFSQDSAAPSVRQPLDLTSLVLSVADDAAASGADVQALFDRPVIVEGDPVALQRLFANLIDNAVKYGSRARVLIARRGHEAVATIVDGGPGLPPEELEQVFIPFYRTKAAQDRAVSGVGLGLSIARAVARAHGGDVVLRSEGAGLLAEVVLPLAR